jgi:hypothetical protein
MGLFAIEWLELNQIDKANSLFARQFDNVRAPFYVSVSIFRTNSNTRVSIFKCKIAHFEYHRILD